MTMTEEEAAIGQALYGGGEDEAAPDETTEGLYGGDSPEEKPEWEDKEAPKEPKPEVHVKRVSAAKWLTIGWASVGRKLQTSGTDIPVGRVIQFQAPLAGYQFDEMLAGSFLDRLLQPLLRSAEKAEGLGSVIVLPALIGLYERRPELGPGIYPVVRSLMESSLEDMAPILKKERAERRKTAQTVTDLSDVFEDMKIPRDVDPIDFLLSGILAPPEGATEQPTPDE